MRKNYLKSANEIIQELKELITADEKLMLYNFCKNKGRHVLLSMFFLHKDSIDRIYTRFSDDSQYLSQYGPSLRRAKLIYLTLVYTDYGRRTINLQRKILHDRSNWSSYMGVRAYSEAIVQFLYDYEFGPIYWPWEEKNPFEE